MLTVERFLDSVVLISPSQYKDERGLFFERYNQEIGQILNFPNWKQENQSHSTYNVFRGMHFQINPKSQAKLVSCVKGEVTDIIIDIRPTSPTFQHTVSVTLSDNNNKLLYVPKGFAHGFYVDSEDAIVQYKCDEFYSKADERGFNWKDSLIGGVLPKNRKWIVSDKDNQLPTFNQLLETTSLVF